MTSIWTSCWVFCNWSERRNPHMDPRGPRHALVAVLVLALHAAVIAFVNAPAAGTVLRPAAKPVTTLVYLNPAPDLPKPQRPDAAKADRLPRARPDVAPPRRTAPKPAPRVPQATAVAAIMPASAPHPPAYRHAPPAPTAREWALAATYSLKNSKRYRYTWGQQVRSMMGTALEGPDQGVVRFRIEIAPDGSLTQLQTLWSTSAMAEQLARQAILNMPALPPTPNGKPLIFEKTISFQPFESDGPPVYKDDCLPDPPVFRNPFVWDGKSAQMQAAPVAAQPPDPQAMEECLKQLPQDSVEAEAAHDQRQLDQWDSPRLGR